MSTPLWRDLTTSSRQTARDHDPIAPNLPEADLYVVGLGASGLAAVIEGCRRGLGVVGIDAGSVGCGAAGRNAGFMLAGPADFHHHAAARLGRERAAALYRLTLEELDRSAMRRTGSLRIAASDEEEADCAAHGDALAADGFPVERYEGPEGRGLLFPTDGVVDPLARCHAMAGEARAAGARLVEDTVVERIDDLPATMVVVAVDGGLEDLVPSLRGRVRTTRLQILATEPEAAVRFSRPVYRRWGYDYWQQLPDGRIVLGGCRDHFADREWDAPAEPTEDVQACLDGLLRDVVRSAAPVTHRWAGRVAFTEDRLPVIERLADGVVAVGGYSGTGNVIGPICGRAAVELLVEGSSPTAEVMAGA